MSSQEYVWRPVQPASAHSSRRSTTRTQVAVACGAGRPCRDRRGGGGRLRPQPLDRLVGTSPADALPRAVTPRGDLMDLEKTTIKIYNDAKPSVVHITALTEQQGAFGLNVQEVPADTGTGFIWDKNGYIVTNFHVVQNAVVGGGAVQVTLADQTTPIDGTIVGYYPDKDVAVIKITPPLGTELKPIPSEPRRTCKSGKAPSPSATRSAWTIR